MRPSISVVMPYYRNERTLIACLKSFARQKEIQATEIIVVDDGGPVRADGLCNGLDLGVSLKLLRTDRAGQSGATNRGIQAARGELVMLTCADIIGCDTLLAEHVKAHQRSPGCAVLGRIPYAANVKMTPFMQFLRTSGVQFDFEAIDDPDDVNCLSLYAPNVSVRAVHLDMVGGFDEAFGYGYQDTDLGIRLSEQGVKLVYSKDAVGFHDHPNDFLNFVKRQELMGEAAIRMLQMHPKRNFDKVFTSGAQYALPRLKAFDVLLADALRIEANVIRRPNLLRNLRRQLFDLYRLVLLLAVYRGALRRREGFPEELLPRVSELLDEPLASDAGSEANFEGAVATL